MDPLILPAELSVYLRRSVEPAAAAQAVSTASGLIRDYCGWPISYQAETFIVDGSETNILNLPTMHLVAVDAVRIHGIDVQDFEWSARGTLYRAWGWPPEFRGVQVDCTHGYQQIPDAVRVVAFGLAAAYVLNPGGVLASKTVGAVTHTYRRESQPGGPLTELQAFQLSGYRLP